MEDSISEVEVGDFVFSANFDSGNLGKVELVPKPSLVPFLSQPRKNNQTIKDQKVVPKPLKPGSMDIPDYEFNIWTRPDCLGTPFQNTNRTWFYFGMQGGPAYALIKINIVDLNKQGRMFRDGMAPVFRYGTSRPWERIRDKPVYSLLNNVFILSFKFRTLDNPNQTTYFAFTYPYSYVDLQSNLLSIDERMRKPESLTPKTDLRFSKGLKLSHDVNDVIYYCRELLCYSLEGRRIDLITISSRHNILDEREPRLPHLFPDDQPRCRRFQNKKVVFVSARVHPGETPSSFVLNGLLNLLLNREDPVALLLRRMFVFKLIPMLNPDGVARGHYRTDTRGVNLNRYYLKPDNRLHPSIFAARSLIRYYHYGEEVPDEILQGGEETISNSDETSSQTSSTETLPMQGLSIRSSHSSLSADGQPTFKEKQKPELNGESGIYMYIDMHGHASKKGIFIYGNHFSRVDDRVDCMLFPKLLSINSQNFHFASCNFTERNMYLRDKRDGTTREGSGRVAVLRLTGLIRSYTLECNYNTGRMVNVLPHCCRELPPRSNNNSNLISPPKYTPSVYEDMGRAIGVSILDLANGNPWSRLPNSEFHTLTGLKDWLRMKTMSEALPFGRSSSMSTKTHRPSHMMSLRASRVPTKIPIVQLTPINKSLDTTSSEWDTKEEGKKTDWEEKESSNTCQQQTKRPLPLRTTTPHWDAIQVSSSIPQPKRSDQSSAVRSICAKNLKQKQGKPKIPLRSEDTDSEKKKLLNSENSKPSAESSCFKPNAKRIKMSKVKDLGETSEINSFSKATTSTDSCLPSVTKKRILKAPTKFKKSLEKRRSSDKKNKMLFKKASKLAISSNELAKAERKRRNGIAS